jgi:small subunit ribosomal protein S6
MRRYETVVIVDPDITEDQRQSLFEKMKEIIAQKGGEIVTFDDWGTRHLAYEIRKKKRGQYIRLDYCGSGAVVTELERFSRIDDRVIKYLTVKLDEDTDVETAKAQLIAQAKPKSMSDRGSSAAVKDADEDADEKDEVPDNEVESDIDEEEEV